MYFWRLATEMIASVDAKQSHLTDAARQRVLDKFLELQRRADTYYAYSYIYSYIQEPFTTLLPENVFNVALYLWNILASNTLSGISTQHILADGLGLSSAGRSEHGFQ